MKFRKNTQEATPQSDKRPNLFKRLGHFLDDITTVEPLLVRTEVIAAEAKAHALGPNQAVVDLAEVYRKAAEKRKTGIFSQRFDKKDRKRLHPTNTWSVVLRTQENESQKTGLLVERLPDIVMQNEVVKVNALSIYLSSSEEGVSSIIWINKHAGLVDTYHNLNRPPRFGNALRIDVSMDGSVSFGRESDRSTGYTDVSFIDHTLTGFLEQVTDLPELH